MSDKAVAFKVRRVGDFYRHELVNEHGYSFHVGNGAVCFMQSVAAAHRCDPSRPLLRFDGLFAMKNGEEVRIDWQYEVCNRHPEGADLHDHTHSFGYNVMARQGGWQ